MSPDDQAFCGRERGWLPGLSAKRRRGRESRHSSPVFPLSRHDPAGSRTTAGSADRAVLYDFRRFPAGILATSSPLVRHRPGTWSRPVEGREREVGLRTHHTRDTRGGRGPRSGAAEEPRNWRSAGAARDERSLGIHEPFPRAELVEQSPEARGTDTQARPGLALLETKVRFRSHGPAAKGALRTRRLENRQDGASVLSATRRRTA